MYYQKIVKEEAKKKKMKECQSLKVIRQRLIRQRLICHKTQQIKLKVIRNSY